MSGIVLVCILPAGEFPGVDVAADAARRVTGHPVEGLTLWVRSAPHPPTASLDEIRAHHRVVADAWAQRPAVLPVRFGQWFATIGELTAALAPNLESHARALERTAGAGEFSVRILDPALAVAREQPPEAAASGTAYLRAAAARERTRAEATSRGMSAASELREALGPLVRADRVDPMSELPGLAVATHLVGRNDEDEYRAAADRFAAAQTAVRFVRTGPWPPWSFTS